MKNTSLLLICLLMLYFNDSFSQKCKVSEDPFTKETVASFDYESRTVYFEYKSGAIKLEFLFNYEGELNVKMPQGTELLVSFENGETLKLTTSVDAAPKTQVISSQYSVRVLTQYAYIMTLTKEDLNKFASSKIVLVRYPDTKGGTIDLEAKRSKKFAGAIFKGAECIKTNL